MEESLTVLFTRTKNTHSVESSCFFLEFFHDKSLIRDANDERKRKMNLLSNNEWNKLCACVLYIISWYLSHFIWFVISVKDVLVFIIRFHRFAICISITKNIYICISFGCLAYVSADTVYFVRYILTQPVFPVRFYFIEIKQLERRAPLARSQFITPCDRFTFGILCFKTQFSTNEGENNQNLRIRRSGTGIEIEEIN